jgi:putative serine protease PepD
MACERDSYRESVKLVHRRLTANVGKIGAMEADLPVIPLNDPWDEPPVADERVARTRQPAAVGDTSDYSSDVPPTAPFIPTATNGNGSPPPLPPLPPLAPPWSTPPTEPPTTVIGTPSKPSSPRSPGQRAMAVVAAALVAGGVAGGVTGRITAPKPTSTTIVRNQAAGTGSLAKLNDIQTVLAAIQPAVVSIKTQAYQGGRFFPTTGAGSGTIVTADGEVLTNAHVVAGATSIEVMLNGEQTARPADLIGANAAADVALIKIRNASGLPVANLGKSSDLRVGDSLVAIGNALDLGATPTVTEGIVSALNRSIDVPGESLRGLIQTDAAINPGNSGGPLVDSQGRVVGVNTAVAGDAQNIGFALAIDNVKTVMDALRANKGTASSSNSGGSVTSAAAFLGVSVGDSNNGAVVQQVQAGSPADKAAIQVGDIITAVGSNSTAGSADVVAAVRTHKAGDKVKVSLVRNGQAKTVDVTLG